MMSAMTWLRAKGEHGLATSDVRSIVRGITVAVALALAATATTPAYAAPPLSLIHI